MKVLAHIASYKTIGLTLNLTIVLDKKKKKGENPKQGRHILNSSLL